MKFSVNKNILQKHLTEHSKVVPLRTTLPVLSCAVFSVKEQKLTIKTSDLEQTIISFFDVGYPYVDINKPKDFKFKPGTFLLFPGYMPHEVRPNRTDNRLIVSGNLV